MKPMSNGALRYILSLLFKNLFDPAFSNIFNKLTNIRLERFFIWWMVSSLLMACSLPIIIWFRYYLFSELGGVRTFSFFFASNFFLLSNQWLLQFQQSLTSFWPQSCGVKAEKRNRLRCPVLVKYACGFAFSDIIVWFSMYHRKTQSQPSVRKRNIPTALYHRRCYTILLSAARQAPKIQKGT